MKERGIVFSGPSIPAIQSGAKTQTRRLMKPQPFDGVLRGPTPERGWEWVRRWAGHEGHCDHIFLLPRHSPGELCYVKEPWLTTENHNDRPPRDLPGNAAIGFFADQNNHWPYASGPGRYRNARFLPKRLARIWLRILDVRPERVQDIIEEDAVAEGFDRREHFVRRWDELHPDNPFDSNPWVWVYTFERTEQP